MGTPDKVLIGERIILRPIDIEYDCADWFEVMQVPEMHTWTGNHVPADIQEVKEVVLLTYATHPEILAWTIRERTTNQMIGIYWIGVPVQSEVGSWITFDAQRIAMPFWRSGVTSEARRLVYQYAFEELGVVEIHASAWEQNVNSCRSMEHAGFELVRTSPQFNAKHHTEMMQREYVLRKEKWLHDGRI